MKAGLFSRSVAIIIALVLVLPTLVTTATSFTSGSTVQLPPRDFSLQWYEVVLSSQAWRVAAWNSLQVGVLAALIAMICGTALAMVISRASPWVSRVALILSMLPVVVPLVVIGVGIYFVYVRVGLAGNVVGMAIAHGTLGLPFVVINVVATLARLNRSIEEAAQVAGANPVRTFIWVTWPQLMPASLVGGVLAFVSSWDDVIVALFLTRPQFKTLPVVIWSEIVEGVSPETSAAAVLVTLASIVSLVLAYGGQALLQRRTKRQR